MPPVMTLGTTVVSVTRQVSTDGVSAILLKALRALASSRRLGEARRRSASVWLWPPYSSSLNDEVSVTSSDEVRCGPRSPLAGSPNTDTSNRCAEATCQVALLE